jgi:hypothetical protein
METIVDRGPAHVDSDLAFVDRNEFLFFARQCVVYLHLFVFPLTFARKKAAEAPPKRIAVRAETERGRFSPALSAANFKTIRKSRGKRKRPRARPEGDLFCGVRPLRLLYHKFLIYAIEQMPMFSKLFSKLNA